MAVVLLAGCAAHLARHPLASNVDKAVEAAAADKGFPNAAEAGLANIDGDTSRS
jgi:hypothetical protein